MILEAKSDDERREVQRLFEASIPDISPTAVPAVEHDPLYAPTVAQFRDPATGRLVGAALACRAQVAAGAVLRMRAGRPTYGMERVLDRHRELDLMAVTPEFRGRGVGSHLLAYLDERLRALGVRVMFGNVTDGLDADRLRGFYQRHGFTVLDSGVELPPLLGMQWVSPMAARPTFYFYKLLVS